MRASYLLPPNIGGAPAVRTRLLKEIDGSHVVEQAARGDKNENLAHGKFNRTLTRPSTPLNFMIVSEKKIKIVSNNNEPRSAHNRPDNRQLCTTA
jgi:hypothetical protein